MISAQEKSCYIRCSSEDRVNFCAHEELIVFFLCSGEEHVMIGAQEKSWLCFILERS